MSLLGLYCVELITQNANNDSFKKFVLEITTFKPFKKAWHPVFHKNEKAKST